MKLEDTIRTIPDFPKPGILFRDVTTLFKNPEAFHQLISDMAEDLKDKHVDVVVGPEARGFIMGSALAYALGAGFVPARKPGKLPCETVSYEYSLEYGTDSLEYIPTPFKGTEGSGCGRFAGDRRHGACGDKAY